MIGPSGPPWPDPQRANSVLGSHVPAHHLAQLAPDLPVSLEGSFVAAELRQSQTDPWFEVRLRSCAPAFVYVLLEHKSHADPGTALQVMCYKTRIWGRSAQGKGSRLRARPGSIPLGFYHGREPWSAPGSLAEMVVGQELSRLEATFGSCLRDLGALELDRLADKRAAWAGLVALRSAHRGWGGKGGEGALAAGVAGGVAGRVGVHDTDHRVCYERMGAVAADVACGGRGGQAGRGERVLGEVVQQQLDPGREQGLERGKVNTLVRVLEHGFGKLPQWLRQGIGAATAAELDAQLITALDASSLPEIFGNLGPE